MKQTVTMTMAIQSPFALVKWLEEEEDTWDVIPVVDILSESTLTAGVESAAKFKGEIFRVKVLELGKKADLEKKCNEFIKKISKSDEVEILDTGHRAARAKKQHVTRNVQLCENPKKNLNGAAKPNEPEALLAELKKKITCTGSSSRCCNYKAKYKDALQTIKQQEQEIASLKENHDSIVEFRKCVKKLKRVTGEINAAFQTPGSSTSQKYSALFHGFENPVALTIDKNLTADLDSRKQLANPSSSEGCDQKASKDTVELSTGSGIYIETKLLRNICSDACGDGRKLARNLMMALYDVETELINHSLMGKPSNAFKLITPKPCIDQTKLQAILQFVKEKTNSDLSKVKASLSNKLKELTHQYSNRNNS